MLQDLKVGHILGGTPWKMQVGDIIGVLRRRPGDVLPALPDAHRRPGALPRRRRLRRPELPAPQAGLMAALSQGIVGGEMAWPLVLVGIAMGISLILIKVRSPMLFSVGMYLPLETTFAIFVGGIIRGIVDKLRDKRGFNDAQKARVENAGVLVASGLIAGEALIGPAGRRGGRVARRQDLPDRSRPSPPSPVARHRRARRPGLVHDPHPALQGGRRRRAGAADGGDVGSRTRATPVRPVDAPQGNDRAGREARPFHVKGGPDGTLLQSAGDRV